MMSILFINKETKGALSHWFRYVDDMWVKKRTCKVVAFTKHINSVNDNINLTTEGMSNNKQAFLDGVVSLKKGGSVEIENLYQCFLFDSHHPLDKLGVSQTLHHQAERNTDSNGSHMTTMRANSYHVTSRCE